VEELEANVERWHPKGVKLYTAEWKGDSRGWKLTDPEAYRYLAKSEELGIKNIHVHKGPTIWPLDKDAFDVSDVDHAATDFPQVAALRLGDAVDTPDRERLRARHIELGLPGGDDDPLLMDTLTGSSLEVDTVRAHLGRARLTRVSLEANAGMCRDMLHDRYTSIGVGEKEE